MRSTVGRACPPNVVTSGPPRRVDARGRLQTASAAIENRIELRAQSTFDLRGIIQRQLVARQHQRRAHDWLTELLEQHARHRMIGHADPDGAALFMLQSSRHLARRLQQKRVRAGCAGLQQSKLRRVDTGIFGDLGQIATHQREVMVTIGVPDAANALEGVFVTDVTTERVTRIGRIRDHATTTHDFGGLPHETLLRVFRVEFEALHDTAIIARCRPCSSSRR